MKTNLPSAALRRCFWNAPAAAFSLVEVVLAVGIMALGVVTILGLLPHGMEMSRKTANEQAETRILDQIVGELQSSDWATMGGLIGGGTSELRRYFDDQGLDIPSGSGELSQLVNYVARVKMVNQTEVTAGMPVPSRNGTSTNANLRRVQIEVVPIPDPLFNFDTPPAGVPVRRYTQLVARTRN